MATPYYKPENSKIERAPDDYLYKTDEWLVFPHEIDDLSSEEVLAHKPELEPYLNRIATAD